MRFITDARDRSMLAVVVTRSSEGQCIGLVTIYDTSQQTQWPFRDFERGFERYRCSQLEKN